MPMRFYLLTSGEMKESDIEGLLKGGARATGVAAPRLHAAYLPSTTNGILMLPGHMLTDFNSLGGRDRDVWEFSIHLSVDKADADNMAMALHRAIRSTGTIL